MTNEIFQEITNIAYAPYEFSSDNSQKHRVIVTKANAQRAYDITKGNIEQYKLLMNITFEDTEQWSMHKLLRCKSITESTDDLIGNQQLTTASSKSTNKLISKANKLKVEVLLHGSLVFIKSSLYTDRELKDASIILDKVRLRELVDSGYLHAVKTGVISKFHKTCVYIKMIPENDEQQPEFIHRLSEFQDDQLTYQS